MGRAGILFTRRHVFVDPQLGPVVRYARRRPIAFGARRPPQTTLEPVKEDR